MMFLLKNKSPHGKQATPERKMKLNLKSEVAIGRIDISLLKSKDYPLSGTKVYWSILLRQEKLILQTVLVSLQR
jgi:hypothetical protein